MNDVGPRHYRRSPSVAVVVRPMRPHPFLCTRSLRVLRACAFRASPPTRRRRVAPDQTWDGGAHSFSFPAEAAGVADRAGASIVLRSVRARRVYHYSAYVVTLCTKARVWATISTPNIDSAAERVWATTSTPSGARARKKKRRKEKQWPLVHRREVFAVRGPERVLSCRAASPACRLGHETRGGVPLGGWVYDNVTILTMHS